MADLGLRRWVADPAALLLLLIPLTGWTAVGIAGGRQDWLLPALALAALVAGIALSGST